MSKRFPGRKLSVVRLIILTAIVASVSTGGVAAWGNFQDARTAEAIPSIFSGYVDVTATPSYAFEAPASKEASKVLLAFVVADPKEACTPSWGAAYSLPQAASELDLDRRVARLQQLGGSVAVSFGGRNNTELAVGCTDPGKLTDAYRAVVNRYNTSAIDVDIEGAALSDLAALERRSSAIAALQQERRRDGKELIVWLTLPADPNGLTTAGSDAVRGMITAGVDLAGVNAMTMDYGDSKLAGRSMFENAVSAAEAAHRQLSAIYRDAGKGLGSETVWRKIGLTPMIGQNDIAGEIFTLTDARQLSNYAADNGVGRLSIWSLNRDRKCSPNFPDVKQVSDSCSGVDQGDSSFATILSADLAAGPVFEPTPLAQPTVAPAVADNPSTSPYPVWSENTTYSAGERTVWHSYVYEAKWWTRADTPDNPVLQNGTTPWRIIGPVLPGDRQTPPLTAPVGTAPAWEPATIYRKGDRVLFEGRVFEAKWWTQTDSPDAERKGSLESPWAKLPDAELLKIMATAAEAAPPAPTVTAP